MDQNIYFKTGTKTKGPRTRNTITH